MDPAPGASFRLGEWLVEPALGRISGARGRVHLRPLLTDLLMLLAREPGRPVPKDEIARSVWGRRYFSESSLTRIVAELRQALGDDIRSPRYIETIPKRGYRLIVGAATPDPAPPRVRLAVLPFENLSGDPSQEYFSDGMTEEMIGQLAELAPEALAVVARTSAMHYKGTRQRVSEIASELRVEYVLEGSVRRSDNRLRISAQLIRAADESHVWSHNYDAELRDLIAVQTEVAEAIARRIDVVPRETGKRAFEGLDPDAHEAFLRGLHAHGQMSPAGLATAAACFERAAGIAPSYARAWARLAASCTLASYFGFIPARDGFARAEAAAARALSLDDSQVEAHSAMGFVHWMAHWDLVAAEREYMRALELAPHQLPAHFGLALFLGAMKEDHAGAARHAAQAEALDPLSTGTRASMGWPLYWARRHEEAIRHGKETLRKDPNCPPAWYLIGHSAAVSGKHEEAIAAMNESAARFGDPFSLAYLAMVCGLASRRAEAEEAIARLQEMAAVRPVRDICFAWATLGLGNPDETIDWLEKVYEQHDSQILWIRVSAVYDCLRGHPRFQRLVERLPLPPRATLSV
jgi:TolB-like protein